MRLYDGTDFSSFWNSSNLTILTPKIDINVTYPSSNINASKNTFFNVSVNVTCRTANCGTINVSLFGNESVINTTIGATPFYTNASTNPVTTASLNKDQSETVMFWVNATGEVGSVHPFLAYANLTNVILISNQTNPWNVTIDAEEIAIAIQLSTKLGQQINWTLSSLPIYNVSADGNNGTEITEYFVNISVTGGTADLYMKANDNLMTSGGDILVLGNETYSYNSTNVSVPSDLKYIMTTNFSDNKIGTSLVNGAVVHLKFFLNAPAAQAAGNYNNTLFFKAVENGATP
jgi:hypothetical protein